MKLPFGKSKPEHVHDENCNHEPKVEKKAELSKPKQLSLENVSLPEGATAVVIGLDASVNPFIRSVGPVSQAQLALMSSYFTGLVMANWQQLLNPQPTAEAPVEVTPEAPQE